MNYDITVRISVKRGRAHLPETTNECNLEYLELSDAEKQAIRLHNARIEREYRKTLAKLAMLARAKYPDGF